MNRILIVLKQVCFSMLIFLCIIIFLIFLSVLSVKVSAGADTTNTAFWESDEREVILFYGNEEFIVTGNQQVPRIVRYKKILAPGDKGISEAVVRELFNSPGSGMLSMIPPKAVLLDAKIEFNRAVINFSSENLYGGSMQEAIMLEQIVHSMAENFGVEEVLILLDGKTAETLMGHLDISAPIPTKEHMLEY